MKKKAYSQIASLITISAILIISNHYLIMTLKAATKNPTKIHLTGNLTQDSISIVIAQGVPAIYGTALGVDFDKTQESINTMKQFDPGYGKNKIQLNENEMQRYIDITTKISCEFCCSAKSLSFSNGKPACGCAHSQAMRGLTAYLLKNYPNFFNNDEILRELARWKGRFFPKQMINKLTTQIQSANYTPDISSLLMGIDISNYNGQTTPLPSEIKNLPSMVGGC